MDLPTSHYMKCASQRPRLHLGCYAIGLNIADALKQTKCRKCPKFDCASVEFDCIDVCEVMYFPSSFDNVIFLFCPLCPLVFSPQTDLAWMEWRKSMTAMLGKRQKQPTSITTMGCHSCVQHVQVMCNAQTTFVIISSVMEVLDIASSGQGPLLSHFCGNCGT
jgi:hypothetical protein